MEKRELKMYEAPSVEIVEMEVAAPLLAVSVEDSPDFEF